MACPCEGTGYKTFQTRPPLPYYISPWRYITSCSEDVRMKVLCQNGSDNNYRMKPTSAWALAANGMNFELLFTTEVIPPSRWVSNSRCKQGLGRIRQSIQYIPQCRYYNVSNWQLETLFKGLGWATQPPIYHQPTEAQLKVNIYCIFLFQMGGNLECIRYCIYDSTASSLCSSVFPLFHPIKTS